ncbi:OmpH family outer membrane protein [Dyella solisilvae]|uniref:OmpH family outer membrane protein n=1 Tax=Dyella solisilvae TaxID=1920168 RepID=A0A370K5B9_9GAMM|nr:OmpH family outer membrane protein [Dyella solisilvae]RDI97834.1 OmpH family outer membrane protein [Dyella solisilvae]
MTTHRPWFTAALVVAAGLSVAPMSSTRADEALGGNALPGLCMLSREAVFVQSKVGQAASQHLNQLAAQARTQLESQGKPLQAEVQSFQQKAPSLTDAQRKEQGEALQAKVQAFQQQQAQLGDRVQLTAAKARQTIAQSAEPIVADVYKSHKCGLLLNRDAVLGGNMTHDLTAEVVEGLDRKITTINFSLEPLPQSQPHSSGK